MQFVPGMGSVRALMPTMLCAGTELVKGYLLVNYFANHLVFTGPDEDFSYV